jgi:hypothetical protein
LARASAEAGAKDSEAAAAIAPSVAKRGRKEVMGGSLFIAFYATRIEFLAIEFQIATHCLRAP